MASKVIYPPIVESYMPAFQAGSSAARIYFSLSKYNSSTDFSSVHASVVKQDTGMSVVNSTSDSNGKYRATGIILNLTPVKVLDEDNLYYIEIENEDLKSQYGSFSGWIPGWIYKVQIRLSTINYSPSSGLGQAAWLNAYASEFSEWSTVCTLKATGKIDYEIPILNIDTRNTNSKANKNINKVLYLSTLELFGHFYREEDPSELIKYYEFILYDENDKILEETGKVYTNQYQDNDSFNYIFKTELIDQKSYKLAFIFETINEYIGGFYKTEEKDNRFSFVVSQTIIDRINCEIKTAEHDPEGILKNITSVHQEEEEGRIGLKLFSTETTPFNGNICIRRSDSKSNFQLWTDIKKLSIKNKDINDYDLFYDYTIESGIWYKYGVQLVDNDGNRGILVQTQPVMRNFEYSFLLGKDNVQLKLMFDNTMESYNYQISDAVSETIGGKYPVITRNAATRYRTFPINGLISFWMDENKIFCDKKVIYEYEDIINLYNNYNIANNIIQYDYIFEREFRERVLSFLQDGELKLFKSPTEGNIIVRLTDVNCSPDQSLNRMIYSFSATAYEMAESNMENYLKYNFYETGDYESDFSTYETKLGQLVMNFPVGTNIIKEIYNKYDGQGNNFGGYTKSLKSIHHLKITFEDEPLRTQNAAGATIIGNTFSVNNKLFSVYDQNREYEFDDRLIYTTNNNISFLGDSEGNVNTIKATVDFLYDITTEIYKEKQIQAEEFDLGWGQLYGNYSSETNLYREIYYKYNIETEDEFRQLNNITAIRIETDPNAVFRIKDRADTVGELHYVDATGILYIEGLESISDIIYVGVNDGVAIIDKDLDISLDYRYTVVSGLYKKET